MEDLVSAPPAAFQIPVSLFREQLQIVVVFGRIHWVLEGSFGLLWVPLHVSYY